MVRSYVAPASTGRECQSGHTAQPRMAAPVTAPKELASFDAAGIPVRRWKYADSGLTVCLVKTGGPIVHGFVGIATEAHDDDGLPHTLEHLIFLGYARVEGVI